MDITDTITPNSQQVNAEDLLAGPRTVTITQVEKGSAEQPVFVHLAEYPGRTYRPSKSMRRVLVAAWGPEASDYVGRRLTIYRNPEVTFGREKIGGIQISAMSHIDKPLNVALTVSRGKRSPFIVQPLKDAPAPNTTPTREERVQAALKAIHDATTGTALANVWERIEAGGLDNEPALIDASTQRTDQINQQS